MSHYRPSLKAVGKVGLLRRRLEKAGKNNTVGTRAGVRPIAEEILPSKCTSEVSRSLEFSLIRRKALSSWIVYCK